MGRRGMKRRIAVSGAATLALLMTTGVSPAVGFLPYRTILEAARSPEKPLAFVHDKMLRISLRKALVEADPSGALSISPYVFGGHAYLVGWVSDAAERDKLEAAAHGVGGLGSLSSYLPAKPTGADAPSESAELGLKAKIEEAVTPRLRRASNERLCGRPRHTRGARRYRRERRGGPVCRRRRPRYRRDQRGVTSFLTVPEPGNAKLLQGLLP